MSPRAPTKQTLSAAAATTSMKKTSLRARTEHLASRVTKKWGHKVNVEGKRMAKKLLRVANRVLDITNAASNVTASNVTASSVNYGLEAMDIDTEVEQHVVVGMELERDMDIDTEEDQDMYDILEKRRQLRSGFDYWSSPAGFESFDDKQCLSVAKESLDEALDLLDLSDPAVIDINEIWSLSETAGWHAFLEGNAVSEEQKGLKKVVDKIIKKLHQRRKTGMNLNCLFFF